jgi:hypothetical protein
VNINIRAIREGAVLLLEVSGLMSHIKDAEVLQTAMRRECSDRHAVKIVVDIRRAVLLYTPEQWPKVTGWLLENQACLTPVAFLAGEAQWAPLFQHCLTMSRTGRLRFVFSESAQVAAWLGAELQALRRAREFEPLAAPPQG